MFCQSQIFADKYKNIAIEVAMPIYEKHSFTNEKLPFIFKRVEMSTVSPEEEWANWHENIEMIFVTEGVADIRLDGVESSAKQGLGVCRGIYRRRNNRHEHPIP